jgi:hypothetical protein
VFELAAASKTLEQVKLDGRLLDAKEYAWDGQTLWINATLTQETPLNLAFGSR